MTDKVTICLIGPSRGGKSSLLASWTECAVQGAHGYPKRLGISVREIDETEFAGAGGPAKPWILGAIGGEYSRLRRTFLSSDQWEATPTEDTYEYFFRVDRQVEANGGSGKSSSVLVQIVDAAGELSAGENGEDAASAKQVLEKFDDQIRQAEAIVAVVPLIEFSNAGWTDTLRAVLLNLIENPGDKLQRLVVVFSQYERLFVRFGSMAFRLAVLPQVARMVARSFLDRADWLANLRRFETGGRVEVRLTVTSAYGFVKGHGNPNIDPHRSGEHRFGFDHARGHLVARNLWRPFLTADPFLYAALGEDSQYTFSFKQLDEASVPARPDPRSERARQAAKPRSDVGISPAPAGEPEPNKSTGLWERLGRWTKEYFE
jgi:hypothetical protein